MFGRMGLRAFGRMSPESIGAEVALAEAWRKRYGKPREAGEEVPAEAEPAAESAPGLAAEPASPPPARLNRSWTFQADTAP